MILLMQKVGNKLPGQPNKYFTYPMCDYDKDGYSDATLFHPLDYDLLTVKLKGKKNTIKAWCCGNSWDGLLMEDGDIVTFWKKSKQEDEE
jgi:hypothetical protein